MKHWTSVAALITTTFLSWGCGSECPGSAELTLETLVPDGAEVHCEASTKFDVDGRTVHLTHVEYGELRDCPSGCFSSHLCAIEDGDGVELYSANWYAAEEAPRDLPDECEGEFGSGSTRDCEPAGASHPVTDTAEFQDFAEEQPNENGPFRFCF